MLDYSLSKPRLIFILNFFLVIIVFGIFIYFQGRIAERQASALQQTIQSL